MEHGSEMVPGPAATPVFEPTNFKKCPSCAHAWRSQQDFLNDPNLMIIGYQVNFDHLELGYFLFNHHTCRTTLSILAGAFKNLYTGPIFTERKTQSEECPGYCLKKSVLDPCPTHCECTYVRDIIQTIRNWEKK
jgi:hypothetical protein